MPFVNRYGRRLDKARIDRAERLYESLREMGPEEATLRLYREIRPSRRTTKRQKPRAPRGLI